MIRRAGICSILLVAFAAADALAQTAAYEEEPIRYSATEPHDPVAAVKQKITSGELNLPTAGRERLDVLLRALDLPASSQVMVFSKTSFQAPKISPQHPRAIFFNDDTYLGYIPGSDFIELATTDPKLGTIFYTLDLSPDRAATNLVRQNDNCLQCHGESMTRDTPGLLVRSIFADRSGQMITSAGGFLSTHESPLKERWGGWYVTGSAGGEAHLGNTMFIDQDGKDPQPASPSRGELKDLSAVIDTSAYPSPHSDIVALMVLEHQVEAHNRFTRAAYGTLRALRDEKVLADAMGEKIDPDHHGESTISRIKASCEPLVQYLLMCGETKLSHPITGSSSFAKDFAARGPRDSHGRSLRDLDLQHRLFRYPCSFLVYSRSMTELPSEAKKYVYHRLFEVLSGKDRSSEFAHLTSEDRTAITEFLRDTQAELRGAWAREPR
jgi:hypothetical protein